MSNTVDIIRIKDLNEDEVPSADDYVAIDRLTTRKTTLTRVVNAARPFASQAEAEAGVSSTKAMSPLRTKQAVGVGVASFTATYDPNGLASDAFDSANHVGFTRADILTKTIPSQVTSFRTSGYAAPGDGGGALYIKGDGAKPGGFISADGAGWELVESCVRPEMFGATPVNESGAALQDMLDYGSSEVYLPAGIWRSDQDLLRETNIEIRGSGTLDFSNSASAQLLIRGSLTSLDAPNTDMAKGAKVIRWAADQGLAPGDVVILWNPTNYSFGGRRSYYYDGGMFKMHSVASGTGGILTYEQIPDTYTAANFLAYKLNGVRVTIDGIQVKPCATASKASIRISLGEDVTLRRVRTLTGGVYSGVETDRCYNVNFEGVSTENNSPHVNDEYGLIYSNCQHVRITGALALATRHAIAIGGNDQIATVPNRYITISGMSLFNQPTSATGAADIHGGSDYVTYENCFMAGFSGGGRNVRLIGCTVFGMQQAASGLCVTMPETNGGYIEFIDCDFISQGDGQSNDQGYISVQIIGSEALGAPPEAFVREAVNIRVKNCRLQAPNAGTASRAVSVESSNANVKVNVDIDGLEWDAPQGTAFLFVRETINAEMLSDALVVDNVRGPAGAFLIRPDTTIANVPTREMEQRGRIAHTTTASTLNASGNGTYRYPYSRKPTVSMSIAKADGTADGLTAGQPASTKIYAVSRDSVRGAILAPAAFTAGTNLEFHWSAGVFER